jgi:hypothetical protein
MNGKTIAKHLDAGNTEVTLSLQAAVQLLNH